VHQFTTQQLIDLVLALGAHVASLAHGAGMTSSTFTTTTSDSPDETPCLVTVVVNSASHLFADDPVYVGTCTVGEMKQWSTGHELMAAHPSRFVRLNPQAAN
jgi:hypothetical protein